MIERTMTLVPVRLPDGRELNLTVGDQNEMVKKIIEEFCPRFTAGGVILHISDIGDKRRHLEASCLERLGLRVNAHGKMPDVVIHLPEKNRLVLIEAVARRGPIDAKRLRELKELFNAATARLVFVTVFATRQAMTKHLVDIAWETAVWVAEAPSHMIHFNGGRLAGPYDGRPALDDEARRPLQGPEV